MSPPFQVISTKKDHSPGRFGTLSYLTEKMAREDFWNRVRSCPDEFHELIGHDGTLKEFRIGKFPDIVLDDDQ